MIRVVTGGMFLTMDRWDTFQQDVFKSSLLHRHHKRRHCHQDGHNIDPLIIVSDVSPPLLSSNCCLGIYYYHAESNTSQWVDPRLDAKVSASESTSVPSKIQTPFQPPPPPPRARNHASLGDTPSVSRALSNPETLLGPPVITPSMRPQSDRLGGRVSHTCFSFDLNPSLMNMNRIRKPLMR